MVNQPYQQSVINNKIIRQFTGTVLQKELIWHQDTKDRYAKVISGKGWQIQLDNQLPVEMKVNNIYYIPKMIPHRIMKGEGDLIVEIEER